MYPIHRKESTPAVSRRGGRTVIGSWLMCVLASSVLIPTTLASLTSAPLLAQAIPVENRVLVRVNDRIVTKYDYERQVAAAMAALTAQIQDPEELRLRREELPRQVLRGLWDDALILSRADQLGMSITEFELDEAISQQMQQFGMETREELEEALGQSGLTLDRYRKNLRSQLLQRQVLGRELFPRVVLEEDELRRVYRENLDDYQVAETRELQELVVLEGDAGSELDAMAARVASAWSKGEAPTDITEREGDAVRFIDLGAVVREDLAPVIAEAAFSLSEGQVSEPMVARGGLHIVKTVKITPVRVQPFEEVREQVDQDERVRRMEKERDVYLRELEEKAYYEANLPTELAGFRTTTGFNPGPGGLSGISSSPLGLGIEEVEASEGDAEEAGEDGTG